MLRERWNQARERVAYGSPERRKARKLGTIPKAIRSVLGDNLRVKGQKKGGEPYELWKEGKTVEQIMRSMGLHPNFFNGARPDSCTLLWTSFL
jgi:hypothetical protein